uniref:Uncharacterized protein n=1 Tax=Helianthus annuus TaxID=4232 RepID=A0A251UMZ2_HELAN
MNTRRCRRPFESDSGSNGYPMEAYYYRRPFESVSSGDDLQISSCRDQLRGSSADCVGASTLSIESLDHREAHGDDRLSDYNAVVVQLRP